jgi:hypothetical protein
MAKFLLLLLFVIPTILGDCPAYDTIDIMSDEDTFKCAIKWYGPGADHPIQACNECPGMSGPYHIPHDTEASAPAGQIFPVGSLYVLPGKKLTCRMLIGYNQLLYFNMQAVSFLDLMIMTFKEMLEK